MTLLKRMIKHQPILTKKIERQDSFHKNHTVFDIFKFYLKVFFKYLFSNNVILSKKRCICFLKAFSFWWCQHFGPRFLGLVWKSSIRRLWGRYPAMLNECCPSLEHLVMVDHRIGYSIWLCSKRQFIEFQV